MGRAETQRPPTDLCPSPSAERLTLTSGPNAGGPGLVASPRRPLQHPGGRRGGSRQGWAASPTCGAHVSRDDTWGHRAPGLWAVSSGGAGAGGGGGGGSLLSSRLRPVPWAALLPRPTLALPGPPGAASETPRVAALQGGARHTLRENQVLRPVRNSGMCDTPGGLLPLSHHETLSKTLRLSFHTFKMGQ